MNLPKQVQEQERKANEALERMKQPEAAATESTPPPQETPPQPAVPAPDWEARYKALQGKYNAEVPRLSELVRTQQSQIEGLKRDIEVLKSKPAADTPASVAADLPEDLRDRFDPDLIDLVDRIAQNRANKAVEDVKPVVEKVSAEEAQRSQQLLREQQQAEMLEALTDLAPDWEKIDVTAEFATFLQQTDPATGKPLQETLTAAVQRFDAARAARIFNAFKRSALETPAAPPPPSLAAQVVPDIAGPGTSTTAGDKRIMTRQEAKDMLSRAARLSVTNPDAADKIEREVDLAMREGRIR